MEWEFCGDMGDEYDGIDILREWAGTEVKVDGDGW